jgi:hypothetical protein
MHLLPRRYSCLLREKGVTRGTRKGSLRNIREERFLLETI